MARGKSELRGVYWGITSDGQVNKVYEYWDRGSISLSSGTVSHPVMKGRSPRMEVVVVFNLYDVEHVTAASIGSEYEKQIIDKLNAKAVEKKK